MNKETTDAGNGRLPKTSKNYPTVTTGYIVLLFLLFVFLGCSEAGQQSQTNPLSFYGNTKPTPAKTAEPSNPATTITGKVVGVSDGDTITVLDENKKQYKIRLQGIDAPESSQPFGQTAKQNLSGWVFGKTVKVLIYKKDRYGRELGTVYLDDKDINLEQVKAGLAWHYKKYQSEQSKSEREEYATAETTARTSKSSLWSEVDAISPDEWRAGKRTNTAKSKTNSTVDTTASETQRTTATDTKGLTVYVTRTGEKYHRAGCRYLSRSQIPISLSDAKAGYDACSVCNPPK